MDKVSDSDSDAAQELLLLVKGSDCMSLALSLYLSFPRYLWGTRGGGMGKYNMNKYIATRFCFIRFYLFYSSIFATNKTCKVCE